MCTPEGLLANDTGVHRSRLVAMIEIFVRSGLLAVRVQCDVVLTVNLKLLRHIV